MLRFVSSLLILLSCLSCDDKNDDTSSASIKINIPFSFTINDEQARCGHTYEGIGVNQSSIEMRDFRFYIHDISLVTDDGTSEPLELEAESMWQTETLAMLDFTDTSSALCADRGSEGTRSYVSGYLPASSDPSQFTKLRFKIGVPEDLNHLDAPTQVSPLNVESMWWGWASGFRFMKVDFKVIKGDQVIDHYYLHTGALGCEGESISGPYSCKLPMIADIELSFRPGEDEVNFDLARLLSSFDLDNGIGCMGAINLAADPNSGKTQPCPALYSGLGLSMETGLSGSSQIAFRSNKHTGELDLGQEDDNPNDTSNPNYWPQPDYERSPSLDIAISSESQSQRSHKASDQRFGANCLRCHQAHGPGLGQFIIGGSILWDDGKPYDGGGWVEIGKGEGHRAGKTPEEKLANFESYLRLPIDANGNIYTTENSALDYQENVYQARIISPEGDLLLAMAEPRTGACNSCHNGSFAIQVPRPK